MASYNGASFIREQIISIQNQTYKNWRLLISDDSSSDNTVGIINEMSSLDKRIVLVNCERQGGVIENFAKALEFVEADHIFFCDQDDIWPPERLDVMLSEFLSIESDVPLMLFTDLKLIDEKNKTLNSSYYEANNILPQENLDFDRLRWKSSIYGCSTLINRRLLQLAMPFPKNITMHDHWLSIVAHVSGQLRYFDYKSVSYRQHSSNVVGGRKNTILGKMSNIKKYLEKIKVAVIKTLIMQQALDERFSIGFDKKIFLFQNLVPYVKHGSKKIYTLIFIWYYIKCSI